MKKILITTDSFQPRWDGVAKFLSEIIPELKKQFNVTVIAPNFGNLKTTSRTIRFSLRRWNFGDIKFAKVDKEILKNEIKKADLIFNQTIGPIGLKTIKYSKKLKKPVISYIHSIEWELASNSVKRFKKIVRFLVKIVARRLYNNSTKLLVPSKETEDILSHEGIKTKKKLVKLGVKIERFTQSKKKELSKIAINMDPTKKIVGYCGRIAREKDLPTLYKAFRLVRQKFPETQLLLVGGLGKERKKWEVITGKKYSKIKNITLAGSVNNVIPYLQAMDIYVLPSLTETSSLSTMEAMSTELPIIATPVGSIKEYVKEGENGLLFPRGDFKQLAQKIIMLLKNPEKSKTLGKNARKTIIENYQWKNTVEKIIKIIAKS